MHVSVRELKPHLSHQTEAVKRAFTLVVKPPLAQKIPRQFSIRSEKPFG